MTGFGKTDHIVTIEWKGGGVGGGGGWEAGGGLHRPTGPFGVAMSPRSASHRPRHDWRALRDVSPTQG